MCDCSFRRSSLAFLSELNYLFESSPALTSVFFLYISNSTEQLFYRSKSVVKVWKKIIFEFYVFRRGVDWKSSKNFYKNNLTYQNSNKKYHFHTSAQTRRLTIKLNCFYSLFQMLYSIKCITWKRDMFPINKQYFC